MTSPLKPRIRFSLGALGMLLGIAFATPAVPGSPLNVPSAPLISEAALAQVFAATSPHCTNPQQDVCLSGTARINCQAANIQVCVYLKTPLQPIRLARVGDPGDFFLGVYVAVVEIQLNKPTLVPMVATPTGYTQPDFCWLWNDLHIACRVVLGPIGGYPRDDGPYLCTLGTGGYRINVAHFETVLDNVPVCANLLGKALQNSPPTVA